jgi:hypothetical protein
MANSPILQSLGFGGGLGDQLSGQVGEETDEERRRRLLRLQGRQDLGAGASLSSVATSIFGGAYGR